MKSPRMLGYGAWNQGWRDAERLPSGPPSPPGCLLWASLGLVLYACIQTAAQGHPFAILLGLAILAGTLKCQN